MSFWLPFTPVALLSSPALTTTVSPEIATEIVKHLVAGNYFKPSCEAAGVSYDAVRKWIARAAEDKEKGIDSPYVQFVNEVTRATAASETKLVERLNVSEDWRAQAFLLERRHRDRWGKAEVTQQSQQILVISDQLAAGMLEALRIAASGSVAQAPGGATRLEPALDAEFSQSSETKEESSE